MLICRPRFNWDLLAALGLALGLVCGCQSPEGKSHKQLSTFRVHLETQLLLSNRTERVTLTPENPVELNVEKLPFLNEGDVKEAAVINVMGGFALSVQLDRRGTWLLEQYTAGNREKHLAIFSQFVMPPEEKLNQGRWLAAPKITKRITDGVLTFTPALTREEAGQVVLGLNNVARKLKTGSRE